jgi:hypothetical protein
MKFNNLYNELITEAEIEKLSQQDPREIYSDEEVKDMDVDPTLAPETGPQEAFKSLEDTLGKFYALGQRGLGADADMVNERVVDILMMHGVDQRDLRRFGDALTSILLGQSVRGYADSQDS